MRENHDFYVHQVNIGFIGCFCYLPQILLVSNKFALEINSSFTENLLCKCASANFQPCLSSFFFNMGETPSKTLNTLTLTELSNAPVEKINKVLHLHGLYHTCQNLTSDRLSSWIKIITGVYRNRPKLSVDIIWSALKFLRQQDPTLKEMS